MLIAVHFGPLDHGRPVNEDELRTAEFQVRFEYQIFFGRLYVSPAPAFENDWMEKWIFGQSFMYSRQYSNVAAYVTDRARVFIPCTDKTTAPEPDVAIYSSIPSGDWRTATPLIVGEVLDGDVERVLSRNVDLYSRLPSIQEDWVFDIRQSARRPELIVHRRTADRWDVLEFDADHVYQTPLLPGLMLVIAPEQSDA